MANKVGSIFGGLVVAATAAIAGAYALGKIAAEKEAEEEEVTLIKLQKESEEKVEESERFHDNVEEKAEEVKEDIAEVKEDVKEAVEDKVEGVKEGVEDVKEAVEDKVEDVKEAVEDKAEDVKEKVEEKVDDVKVSTAEVLDNPYPLLSDKKVRNIKKQINSMLSSLREDEVKLAHYVVFNDAEKAYDFTKASEKEGFTVVVPEDKPLELHLEKVSKADKETLETLILDLAEKAEEAGGAYKGWGIQM